MALLRAYSEYLCFASRRDGGAEAKAACEAEAAALAANGGSSSGGDDSGGGGGGGDDVDAGYGGAFNGKEFGSVNEWIGAHSLSRIVLSRMHELVRSLALRLTGEIGCKLLYIYFFFLFYFFTHACTLIHACTDIVNTHSTHLTSLSLSFSHFSRV
jgi:hypothetical protein